MQNVIGPSGPQLTRGTSTFARWRAMHDVHTEFVDAGIGCCWFARRGDGEPVIGQTEAEAIARLVRPTGIEEVFDGLPIVVEHVE